MSKGENQIPWNEVKCVLWFPDFDSYSENLDRQKILLRNFFEYLAIRMLADALCKVRVVLTMNNIRFSQLQVTIILQNFHILHFPFPAKFHSFQKLKR